MRMRATLHCGLGLNPNLFISSVLLIKNSTETFRRKPTLDPSNPSHVVCFVFFPFPAGAYYPTQAQYQPSVPAAPVIMNPAQQQPAPPPQQPAPPQQHKRERKQVTSVRAPKSK